MILRETIIRTQSKAKFNAAFSNFSIIRRLYTTKSSDKREVKGAPEPYKRRGTVNFLEHNENGMPDDFEVIFATYDSQVQIWLDQAIADFAAEFPKESTTSQANNKKVDLQSIQRCENSTISDGDKTIDTFEDVTIHKGTHHVKKDRQEVLKKLQLASRKKYNESNLVDMSVPAYNVLSFRTLKHYDKNQELVVGFACQKCPMTNRIAVLQFSTDKSVLVVQFKCVRDHKKPWHHLERLLNDQNILKVGGNILHNLRSLKRQRGTYVQLFHVENNY